MKRNRIFTSLLLILGCFFSMNLLAQQIQLPPDFETRVREDWLRLTDQHDPYEKYLNMRTQAYYNEMNIRLRNLVAYTGCVNMNTPCGNGDFEAGLNSTEWDAGFGEWPNFPASLTQGFGQQNSDINSGNSHFTIVSAGTDNVTGVSLVAPGGSTKALRLGNRMDQSGIELISKRFTVSASQTILSFQYATVLQRPSGHVGSQPMFFVRVIDCSNGEELQNVCNLGNNSNMVVADQANPFFSTTTFDGDDLVFTQWICAQVNLSAHVGKTVCVQFINRDCTQGAHFGYTYLDNICSASNCSTGELSFGRRPSCGPGLICVNFSVPQINGQSGTAQIDLNIYQNGQLVHTLSSPPQTASGSYCFPFDPANIPGFDATLPGYDITATADFSINGFTLAPITIGNPPVGVLNGQNNDAGVYCITQCCPGKNLIKNPGFEDGNVLFTSQYAYTSTIGTSSVLPGNYSILTSSEGSQVSSTWNVNCAATGHHLFVNGSTSGTSRIVWSQTVTVQKGKIYKFCVDMKNLPQCGFDVKPKITVQFSVLGFNISNQVIDVPNGSCNWQSVAQTIQVPAGTGTIPMGINIVLNESTAGDGNDLAIDNLTLVEIPQTPISETIFNLSYINVNATTFGLSANPVAPLGRNCGFYWEVEEIDANGNIVAGTAVYNPSAWWVPFPNTFTGYNGTSILSGSNAGVFSFSKRYRIIHGRWCPCTGWNAYAVIVDPLRANGLVQNIKVVRDEQYQVDPRQVQAALSAGATRVSGTNKGDASGSAAADKQISIPAKIHATRMTIYPNPVNDKLVVVLPDNNQEGILKVFNIQGALMSHVPVPPNAGSRKISTIDLAPGTYIIQFQSSAGERIAQDKFVKLKN